MGKPVEKLIPFSNATEAMIWMGNNCDTCRRSGCTKKQSFQHGFLSGKITSTVAEFVGYTKRANGYVCLLRKCQNYSTVRISRQKTHKKDINPSLFN